jgi:hypothetical protein
MKGATLRKDSTGKFQVKIKEEEDFLRRVLPTDEASLTSTVTSISTTAQP